MNTAVEQYKDRIGYQAGLLGGACFFVSLLLLIGNQVTHETIDQLLFEDQKRVLQQVIPADLYDNDPLSEHQIVNVAEGFTSPVNLYLAKRGKVLSAVALQSTVAGWGGDISLILAVDQQGELTGVRVINHKETPGLADKIELAKSSWITNFDGKSLSNTPEASWAVKKDGGEFDQFTGATITPRAVVNGVHAALKLHREWKLGHSQSDKLNGGDSR